MEQRAGISRRELLRRGAGGAAALTLGPALFGCAGATEAGEPRIVIVGAGLAGLSCAYRLRRHGLAATIYEANPERIGGRCWTAREFAGGQTAEHGGEFIDSRHHRMRSLANHFGFELTDLYAVANPGSPRLWLDGELRRRSQMRSARRLFQRRLEAAARRVGPYSAAHHSRAAVEFDQISVAEWLDDNIPGGSRGPWGQYVWADMASEFGLDANRLSALNLFFEFVENTPGADERYHVLGGNDQIVHAIADRLGSAAIRLDAPLEALFRRDDRSFGMRFRGIAEEVVADQVVLALPFTTLRDVDLDRAGLSAKKRRCIDELGMGTNAKVLMQFDRRPQRFGRWDGYMYSDDPFLVTWESTLGEPGRSSIMTTYFGGRSGGRGLIADEAHAPTLKRELKRNLESLGERGRTGLDGIAAGFNGRAWTDHWLADPWVRGSYAAFLPGQYTKYYGYAGKPEGAIHFAGEHTATANQGYLEGAVESGERCAEEIARKV
jgi:monoamine oxidase